MTNIYTINLTATTGGYHEGIRVDGVIVTFGGVSSGVGFGGSVGFGEFDTKVRVGI